MEQLIQESISLEKEEDKSKKNIGLKIKRTDASPKSCTFSDPGGRLCSIAVGDCLAPATALTAAVRTALLLLLLELLPLTLSPMYPTEATPAPGFVK